MKYLLTILFVCVGFGRLCANENIKTFFDKEYYRNGKYIPEWGTYLGNEKTEYDNGFNAGLKYALAKFPNMGSNFEVREALKNNLIQTKAYQMGFLAAFEVYTEYEIISKK